MSAHILQDRFLGVGDMRGFYDRAGMLPTSVTADVALIRSHIAYHCGARKAERAAIRRSRGHSYRVAIYGQHGRDDVVVRIVDHFDHRAGVSGFLGAAS